MIDALVKLAPPVADTLDAWWAATAGERDRWPTTLERALVGGALADRLGFAFAGGYHEALRALVPDVADAAALCATEAGGNQPRAIQTALTPRDGGYTLTGKKKWATWAGPVRALLVVATTGVDDQGRNRLRVVRVAADAPGVRATPMAAPFVPEIPHAELELSAVAVAEADLLPGDGYDRYLKPFRTVEDIHVHAALVGYLIGVVRRHALPSVLIDELAALAVALRGLGDVAAPATHVALAGAIALAGRVVADVERAWQPGDEHARWQRDRVLLQTAGKARAARRERAWELL